jgi:hypothetical protein
MSVTQSVVEHPHPSPKWQARDSEKAVDPVQLVADLHHHLWDRPESKYVLDGLPAKSPRQCSCNFSIPIAPAVPQDIGHVGKTEFVASIGG